MAEGILTSIFGMAAFAIFLYLFLLVCLSLYFKKTGMPDEAQLIIIGFLLALPILYLFLRT